MTKKNRSFWEVPRMWGGQTVIVIGGGPSVENMDLSPIHNYRVIGVNNCYALGDWVDVCFWGDRKWYKWHEKELKEFNGLVVTNCQKTNMNSFVKRVKRGNRPWSRSQKQIAWNGNSGASAISLASLLGATKIILLGFDMKTDGEGKHHWHKEHPVPSKDSAYSRFMKRFRRMKKAMDKESDPVIINATPDSALTIFPMMTLQEALEYDTGK